MGKTPIKINLACQLILPLVLIGSTAQFTSAQSRRVEQSENTAEGTTLSEALPLQESVTTELPDYDTRGYSALLSNAFDNSLHPHAQGNSSAACNGCRRCALRGCLTCRCQRQHCPPLRPFGSYVRHTLNAQITSGIAAQLIFNQLHFTPTDDDSAWRLSPAGYKQLFKVSKLLQQYPGSVIVETTRDPDSDERKREIVAQLLIQTGAITDAEQVVVGFPRVPGMTGLEAQINYQRLLMITNRSIDANFQSGSSSGTGINDSPISTMPQSPNQ